MDIDLELDLENENALRQAAEKIRLAKDKPARWRALKELYRNIDTSFFDPYPGGVDWSAIMTPIEFQVWQDIRHKAVPFWPQYPACGVFFDFADPLKKIAIECDGKHWHDAEKDAKRDAKVAEHGWIVARLTGDECYRSDNPLFDLLDRGDWTEQEWDKCWRKYAFDSATGLIRALSIAAYNHRPGRFMSTDQAWDVLESRGLGALFWADCI